MKFQKASEQNAWDAVSKTTRQVRAGENIPELLGKCFSDQDIDLEKSVFPAIQPLDDNIYTGTLIDQDRRVLEYFVDFDNLEEAEFDDVTGDLGPKDPSHPSHDLKDLITMSLVYYDQHQQHAA